MVLVSFLFKFFYLLKTRTAFWYLSDWSTVSFSKRSHVFLLSSLGLGTREYMCVCVCGVRGRNKVISLCIIPTTLNKIIPFNLSRKQKPGKQNETYSLLIVPAPSACLPSMFLRAFCPGLLRHSRLPTPLPPELNLISTSKHSQPSRTIVKPLN